uniref:Coatomer subunit delta n=2 Tax=Schistosoma mansoni TaxID=6183 RepID=A0A5K4F7M2_SCHMA
MVLLAASVCTRDGKALVSRQFVEMTKARIEGLIATFPKLLGTGKQHTFVETESVRYVYQPLEKLYVLLITTKASNILEDLETLRLFARVIPEYACGTDENDVLTHAFQLIFAFDEIIALGYREDVNLSQIRTYTEMDSHDERVFRAVQENKERDAKEQMKQRARELQQARLEAGKRSGGMNLSGFSNYRGGKGMGGLSNDLNEPRVIVVKDRLGDGNTDIQSLPTTNTATILASVKRSGMQLGGGQGGLKSIDQFVNRLKAEGEVVNEDVMKLVSGSGGADNLMSTNSTALTQKSHVKKENLHLRIEEKLIVQAGRDGGLESMELQGTMFAQAITNEACEAKIQVDTSICTNPPNEHRPPVQLQTHPNIDKKTFTSTGWIQIKPGGKPFPNGQEVGILRWRFQTSDEAALPITVNCWPNEIPGGFEVNVEYELQDPILELENLVMSIPLPPSTKPPLIGNCDGEYEVSPRKNQLDWRIPIVNNENSSGSLEFTLKTERGAQAEQFFPLKLNFGSNKSYCGIQIIEATVSNQDTPINFSFESNFHTEKYEIS